MIVSYRRLSTNKQDIGLDAQQTAIAAWCVQRGVAVDKDFVEKLSAKDMKRPELQAAINTAELYGGILVVAKLDRLSRSVADFAALADRASKNGWAIVVCDLNLDMTTPSGLLIANIMASLSQWERQMIGQRTKEAHAENRKKGIRPGRPVDDRLALRIQNWSKGGMNMHEIAHLLNFNNIPTAWGGKKWYASTIRGVLRRVA